MFSYFTKGEHISGRNMLSQYNPHSSTIRRHEEFNYKQEWTDYVNNSATTSRLIRFGKDGLDLLSTNNSVQCESSINLVETDAQNVTALICGTTFIESKLFPIKNTNLNRSGAAYASSFQGAVPTGPVSPQLMHQVMCGALSEILVIQLAFTQKRGDTNKAIVTSVQKFENCFITMADMVTYEYMTIFEFSYLTYSITIKSMEQVVGDKAHAADGQFSYQFDFSNNVGKNKVGA